MKKFLLPILLFLVGAVYAASPIVSSPYTYSTTLGAGVSDTTTLTAMTLSGDSLGLQLEFNSDSIEGKVLYRYKSQNGYYSELFADASSLVTWAVSTENAAVFTDPLPRIAGAYKVECTVIITNSNYDTKTITANIYTITWR